ncbi:hypothetical protein ACIPY1_06910 [Paenarthrobacter nicotinovorans]|uniref:hypothetical protein n=1 Tax=Paenarthrobacter nicotinovorans TaxID=29320 RepID=UPI0037F40B64
MSQPFVVIDADDTVSWPPLTCRANNNLVDSAGPRPTAEQPVEAVAGRRDLSQEFVQGPAHGFRRADWFHQ